MLSSNTLGPFNLPYALSPLNMVVQETSTYIATPDENGIMYLDIIARVLPSHPTFQMNTFIVHEDPLKNLMIHIFTVQPAQGVGFNAWLNSYGSLGSIFTYPSHRFARISTYLECPNSCSIIFLVPEEK